MRHALQNGFPKRNRRYSAKENGNQSYWKILYPKFGPGQMWEETARIVRQRGGEIRMKKKVVELQLHPDKKRFLLSYQKTKKPENERLLKRIISLHHAHKRSCLCMEREHAKSLRNIGEKLGIEIFSPWDYCSKTESQRNKWRAYSR